MLKSTGFSELFNDFPSHFPKLDIAGSNPVARCSQVVIQQGVMRRRIVVAENRSSDGSCRGIGYPPMNRLLFGYWTPENDDADPEP